MTTDEAVTAEQDFAGNELICEKLLRWKRSTHKGDLFQQWHDMPHGDDGAQWHTRGTPSFTTWADAGLILEALERAGHYFEVRRDEGRWECQEALFVEWAGNHPSSGPLAIRAAAIRYIKDIKP